MGEPTLMGGEFGEDDERMITRLENSQYDPAAAAAAMAAQQQLNAMSGGMPMQQHHHHPATTSGMSPFSRPPSFPPAFPSGGIQSSSPSMMYTPGPPYAPPQQPSSSSPSMKSHQSPLYGHPNSVPPQQHQGQGLQSSMPYGPGGPMMPASVPPHPGGGGRIMSPMGNVGMGNPSTPLGGPNLGMSYLLL